MGRKKELPGEVIECFFGVYLLLCSNPRFKGRTYIGYTVDPNRRISQHNMGRHKGGAFRTHNRGPWKMVLIVHGFPNEISALRFEWAWQHPERSRRLRHVTRKRNREPSFDFALRVLSEMLRVGPWSRLPLTIRWLLPEHEKVFPVDRCPPFHMSLTYGPVVSKSINKKNNSESLNEVQPSEKLQCCLCKMQIRCFNDVMNCLVEDCSLSAHIICLANHFLDKETSHIMPVVGNCPRCDTTLLWGDLIRRKIGCKINAHKDEGDLSDFESDFIIPKD